MSDIPSNITRHTKNSPAHTEAEKLDSYSGETQSVANKLHKKILNTKELRKKMEEKEERINGTNRK